MAKAPKNKPGTSKPGTNKAADRRQVVEQMKAKQRSADRRRNLAIVGVCTVVALLIIGAAAFRPISDYFDQREFADLDLAEIGAAADVCEPVEEQPASGVQDHVPVGTELELETEPPAFGRHYDVWDVAFDRKFYGPSDRPEVGELIHNLEHGYTVMWYDEALVDDDATLDQIRAIADKFGGSDNLRNKFKAVPWSAEDGEPLPEETPIVFTHWSVGGADNEPTPENQVGVFQYCSEVSGAALDQFMTDYPYLDSPEPLGG